MRAGAEVTAQGGEAAAQRLALVNSSPHLFDSGYFVLSALDATVVRILLLPALMLLIGERVWWLPDPLRRLLPRIRLHPAST